jgi:hypothetical protein
MNQIAVSERLFNTPIESGLRSLFILAAVRPSECDLQRLVIYDYLLVHSNDVPSGPPALHPATPLRSGELMVRRTLVEHGLHLLVRKRLVTKNYTTAGIYFAATKFAEPFLNYFNSGYAVRCSEISKWIVEQFQPMSDDKLREYIHENLGRWGAEFAHESVMWEEME